MLILNVLPEHGAQLDAEDAGALGLEAAAQATTDLSLRDDYAPTRLLSLPDLARASDVASIMMKDESTRFGLGSFKALGGAYAVFRLVLDAAAVRLGRSVGMTHLHDPEVRSVARGMTFACATDGNHGRSVAQGARRAGAGCAVFVHEGVSSARVDAIARYGARMIRVAGTYDDSVAEASRMATENGWTVLSDTSWPGYEQIPRLVMQGYTVMLQEAVRAFDTPPTHVFIQAGVGGVAAAVAAYFAAAFGAQRPFLTVVDPARAACLFESAKVGRSIKIAHGAPTVMAMLECYEPSRVAWRILARMADAFMTIEEDEAIAAMNRLARPVGGDPPVVAGESGGAGLAGFLRVARDPALRRLTGITVASRIFVINTEGATDVAQFTKLVGASPEAVLAARV
jgi:diaminopropionate ammonia-lyase